MFDVDAFDVGADGEDDFGVGEVDETGFGFRLARLKGTTRRPSSMPSEPSRTRVH